MGNDSDTSLNFLQNNLTDKNFYLIFYKIRTNKKEKKLFNIY